MITGPDETLSSEKNWSNARILTAQRSELAAFALSRFDARPVAGYISKRNIMHVGVLRDGTLFGNLPTGTTPGVSDPDILTIAIRQGPDPMNLFMGLVIVDQELVFIPASLDVARGVDGSMLLVPEMDMPKRFPGTPLI